MENRITKIIAIDDNQDNLISLKALLNDSFPDAVVYLALSGQKGIDIAKAENPDVILLDVVMPEMDGFEVCRILKATKELCDIPVVFITALKGDKESRIKALECGAEAFLSKPIDECELIAQIHAMLKIRDASLQKRSENERLAIMVEEKTKELKESNTKTLQLLKAIRKEQALIEAIFESIPGFLYVYDESGKLVKWNKKHETMTGYTSEEMSHMTLEKWFDEENIVKVNAAVRDVFEKGYGDVEAPLILKNGEKMMTRSSGVPLLLDGHKYFTGIGLDITERFKAEESVKESEDKFRYIFDNSTIGTSLTLPTGEIQINNTMCNMLGYSAEELRGKHWSAITHPEDVEFSQKETNRLLSGEKDIIHFEKRYKKKDGNVLWADVQSSLRRDASGKPLYFMTSIVDITERKQIYEQMKQNVKDLNESQRLAHLGTWRLNVTTNEVVWSEELYKIYGFYSELPPPPYTEHMKLFTPESWETLSTSLEQAITSGIAYDLELKTITADGSNGWLWVRGEAETDSNGNTIAIWGSAQDITKRKQQTDDMLASEMRYRRLFEAAKDGVLILDAETGMILDVNPFLIQLLGYSREQFIQKAIWDIGSFKDIISNFDKFLELQQKEYVRYNDLPLQMAGGRLVYVEFVSNVYLVNDKKVIQCNIRDISERKKLQNELAQTEEMFRAIFEQAPAGILLTDSATSKVLMANQSFADITGRTLDYLYASSWIDFTHPDDLQEDLDNMELMNAGKIDGYQMNKRYLRPDGSIVWVSMKIVPIHKNLSLNENRSHLCMIDDITYKREYENKLKESEYLNRTFINATSDMVYLKDDKYKHLVVNQQMAEFMGKEIEEIIGKDDFELMPEAVALQCRQTDIAVITNMNSEVTEEVVGDAIYETTKFPVELTNNKVGVGGYIRNITARKKAENDLVYLSYHDFLTGLYNRRFFEEELRRLDIKRNLPLTILMGDTNGLKLINDSFGHAVGDELLIKAATMMKKACRGDDIIARLGGDEFAVILPNTGEMEAIQIVNRITGMVSSESVLNVELSISFGYDIKETEDQSVSETLSNAENNMYRNKLYERSSMRSKTIEVVMKTLFEKSNRESFHSKRVSEICKAIASKMNLDKDDVGKITIAGLVHDVGKIGVDENILNKTGSLNDDEKKEIYKHPEMGWRILSSTDEFSELAVFILAHHEKWDGSGYPNGLKGDEIPIEARIITLADSYDAMTRDRSYRKGLSKEQAIEEIKRCSGKQFDPKIVDIFLNEVLPAISEA